MRPVFGMVKQGQDDFMWQSKTAGQHGLDYDDIKSRWLIFIPWLAGIGVWARRGVVATGVVARGG